MHDLPHDHDHDEHGLDVEKEHPLWKLDTITLTSVGIDVGTATSQIIFSQLILRRLGRELSSRFVVTERDTLYLSPVHLTPYSAGRERVDDQALSRLVDTAYQEAGLSPRDIDTGAIILTGEAIRRDNARAIADLFASQRGNFVCATAGHNFEALLAAHGSGAVAYSGERQCRVLNVDIGGGTTKLAVAERGRVLSTAAFHVGGRLLAVDELGTVTVLEPGGQALARQIGFEYQVGKRITNAEIEHLANHMVQAVLSLAQDEKPSSDFESLWLTSPIGGAKNYDAVIFSGGVGEYVYGKESKSFGDLGAPMGQALRHQLSNGALPWPLAPARECIRATVMGAAQHTVQVSGNTIHRTDESLLPQKNLQVLRPEVDLSSEIVSATIAEAIQKHFRAFDLVEGKAEVALVFHWDGPPTALRIAAFCRGLIDGLPDTLKDSRPIYLVFDHDLAGLVGTVLRDDFAIENALLCLDGVTLSDFDFIDLGKTLEPSGTVPVTIKSLIFHL
ncbi:MAG TPA: ethanolamine ammonia-lyase reactivating factor EutA [Candidatus Binatia bacterium]|jgi:ethanolamine utilization protein EutA|nr:ethanolamine ammonia-lyase reactivating factor EutA [Candidatus Binatia bacterium]